MKKPSIKLTILMITSFVIIFLGYKYVSTKKSLFYSDGGFQRTYLTGAIERELIMPIFFKASYFIPSSNPNVVYTVGEKYLYRVRHTTGKNENYKFDSIPHFPILSNTEIIADENTQTLYVRNLINKIVTAAIMHENKAGNLEYLNQKLPNYAPDQIPLIYKNEKLVGYKKTNSDWKFRFGGEKIDQLNEFDRLSQQGPLKYIGALNQFVYVSLFTNKIILYDSLFSVVSAGKTIDTITRSPNVKVINGNYQFASAPRITNSDFITHKHLLFVRSVVQSDNNDPLGETIILDIYDLKNKLKYRGSIALKNEFEKQPISIHVLDDKLLLLYENNIVSYAIKI